MLIIHIKKYICIEWERDSGSYILRIHKITSQARDIVAQDYVTNWKIAYHQFTMDIDYPPFITLRCESVRYDIMKYT